MSFAVFIVVMLLIYVRPFGIPIWFSSIAGAFVCLLVGSVTFSDVALVWEMVQNSTLTLIGLIIFALSLEKLGFFEVLAHWILRFSLSLGTHTLEVWRFYLFFGIFASSLATLFANDGAILILTPLVFALLQGFKNASFVRNPLIIFLLFMVFLSDFASNLFVFSNLTNIITADIFKISFLRFTLLMIAPQILAVLATFIMFWIIFGRKLPQQLEISLTHNILPSKNVIIFCFFLVFCLLLGIVCGESLKIPLSLWTLFIAFVCALYGILLGKIRLFVLLRESPFSIVVFSLGLFIVVFGLKNAGLLEILKHESFLELKGHLQIWEQVFWVGILSSIGSSLINNLPMVVLGNLALLDMQSHEILTFAHLLGCNIGSKLTPIGSLATLLWLSNLKRYGISIGFLHYTAVAIVVTLPVLLAALCALVIVGI